MKIVVTSDTHLPERGAALPAELEKALEGADMVLHAGDFTSHAALELFQGYRNFVGVHGNMDSPPVRRALKRFETVEIEGIRIGIVHGWGAPDQLPRVLLDTYKHENLQVLVFGHSHRALNEQSGEVLLFNPGSPTDTVFAPYQSFGVLNLEGGAVRGEIIRL